MICTCTLNPSLDYYMEFDSPIEDGKTNRSQLEYYEAGGKGINVSIVLNNLGIPTKAFGFVGGFTKDFYISLLAKYEEIRPNFTYINGHTRINIKCHGEQATELNATGPYITDADMKNLMKKVDRLDDGDYFVLAGITAEYLMDDVDEMIRNASENKVRVVLDTNPDFMRSLLKYKPFMIKTTVPELSQMFDETLTDRDAIVEKAKALFAEGAEHVLVILDNRHAILVFADGVYECDTLHEEKVVNWVGTGDSMIAGFLMNYLRSRDSVDSFRFGASCGSATAYSKGLATREKIDSFYENTKLEKIG